MLTNLKHSCYLYHSLISPPTIHTHTHARTGSDSLRCRILGFILDVLRLGHFHTDVGFARRAAL